MSDEEIINKLQLGTHNPDILAVSIAQARELTELRLASILEHTMTDEQLEAFAGIKNGAQEDIVAWIGHEFGDIEALRQTVFEDLVDELSAGASRDSPH
jgi:hypothetical protein